MCVESKENNMDTDKKQIDDCPYRTGIDDIVDIDDCEMCDKSDCQTNPLCVGDKEKTNERSSRISKDC